MTRSGARAERIPRVSRWSDVQLPLDELRRLEEIAAQVASRSADREPGVPGESHLLRGTGVLFSGEGGVGKTLAAEVLAEKAHRPLYRVDLSQVVSRYIGETAKNLERVFDAAEEGGAVLLLDEADALFGKRSEMEDARDADVAVGYLLERMENHPGPVIFATASRSALDPAFIERLRLVVDFPSPTPGPADAVWPGHPIVETTEQAIRGDGPSGS